LSQGLFDLNGW